MKSEMIDLLSKIIIITIIGIFILFIIFQFLYDKIQLRLERKYYKSGDRISLGSDYDYCTATLVHWDDKYFGFIRYSTSNKYTEIEYRKWSDFNCNITLNEKKQEAKYLKLKTKAKSYMKEKGIEEISLNRQDKIDKLMDFVIEDINNMSEIDNWQPMETAPKDGTAILVQDSDGKIYKAAWLNDMDYLKEDAPEKYKNWCVPESWQDEQGGYFTMYNPKYWQPLPKPRK